MTTVFKHQSYCDPGCYPSSSSSCFGNYGRGRRGSTGSCYGSSHVISYVPSCGPYYGSGYGRSTCLQPVRGVYGYGSGCYSPGNYGCYPYGYGQRSGCYGGYGNIGGFGGFGGSGCYGGYDYGSNYGSSCYGRRQSCSLPCYLPGYRRYSICNPCNPCL